MDCDEFVMALAKAPATSDSVQPETFTLHLQSCGSCAELSRGLLAEADDEHLGQTIGAYQIQSLIGKGGMGRVYLATHPEILSRVAIKVFSKDWKVHANLVSRFFAEARATNIIDHANIVTILDVGRLDDGRPYMVMEYLKGQPLSALVGTDALSDALLSRIMLDVLNALSAAHENKIIHRDLKPDNIFVSPEGRATLLDFGIAKLEPDVINDSAPAATATGLVLGTPQYMSPEQATGDPIDLRTDVYAMGIILYECFVGQRPFDGSSLYRLLDQHVNLKPIRPRELRPDLPLEVENVILRALEKRAEDRYQSAKEMHKALEACELSPESGAFLLTGELLLARPPHPHSAHTVDERPPKAVPPPSPENAENQKYRMGIWGTLGTVLAVSTALLIWWAPFSSDTSPNSTQKVALNTNTNSIQGMSGLADAGVSGTLPTKTLPLLPDASVAPAKDAAPKGYAKQPIRQTKSGIAPLRYLDGATRAAEKYRADAMLINIRLSGIDIYGRIDTSVPGHRMDFLFLSQELASQSTAGNCIIRVRIDNAGSTKIVRQHGKCDTLKPIRAPRCSLASIVGLARRKGVFPKNFAPTDAHLKMSVGRNSRPVWAFDSPGIGRVIPTCPWTTDLPKHYSVK